MPTLTTAAVKEMLQEATKQVECNVVESEAIAALQAIEDTFEGARTAINNSIDTATSPIVINAPLKKRLIAFYLKWKFGQELS